MSCCLSAAAYNNLGAGSSARNSLHNNPYQSLGSVMQQGYGTYTAGCLISVVWHGFCRLTVCEFTLHWVVFLRHDRVLFSVCCCLRAVVCPRLPSSALIRTVVCAYRTDCACSPVWLLDHMWQISSLMSGSLLCAAVQQWGHVCARCQTVCLLAGRFLPCGLCAAPPFYMYNGARTVLGVGHLRHQVALMGGTAVPLARKLVSCGVSLLDSLACLGPV